MRRDAGAADLGRNRLVIEARPLRWFGASLARGGVRNLSETVRDLVRERPLETDEDPNAETAARRTLVCVHDSRLEAVARPPGETAR